MASTLLGGGSVKIGVGAGEIVTITADASSSGAVYRLPDTPTPGEQTTSRIAISANSSLVIGGQAVPSRWQIETAAGALSYSNTPPPPPIPEISNPSNVIRLFGTGAPTTATGVGIAGPCSLYFDLTNKKAYIQAAAAGAATSDWRIVTSA